MAKPKRKDWRGTFEKLHARPRAGRTLIVGSKVYPGREDARTRFPDAFGVDMLEGQGVDMVVDLEEPLPRALGQFAHIECCSVLEHSKRPWLLAANLERLLVPGGTILLSVPWSWRFHGYPNDYWRFTPAAPALLFPQIAWHVIKVVSDSGILEKRHLPAYEIGSAEVVAFERSEVMAFGTKCES